MDGLFLSSSLRNLLHFYQIGVILGYLSIPTFGSKSMRYRISRSDKTKNRRVLYRPRHARATRRAVPPELGTRNVPSSR